VTIKPVAQDFNLGRATTEIVCEVDGFTAHANLIQVGQNRHRWLVQPNSAGSVVVETPDVLVPYPCRECGN
jgi:hypothetical protein